MNKIVTMLCLLIFLQISTQAQTERPLADRPNIQGLKIAFITKQLSLSSEEAQKFWPVYYDFSDKARKIRQEEKADEIAFEEKMLAERKKFKVEMKKILGADDRVNKSLTLDRDFNNVIKKELEARRDMRLQKGLNKQ
ncbi:MAG: hypothetical protein B7Y15_02205 [Bacteroidetes bacterium 24-39-8]|jgi:hypothetical protein|nr:MAG: hypothetical protein B7Y69_05115 [Sphingobacteriia bacterium 35-40-8]OYZ52654.1 MAG: hypothetical protein B7Y15_02205 [Bacteroidetes bacterium 24-39-8]OZA64509.1 MAG: hypothetical protein B7X72_08750 [Sphingobacteriia bacterium 39-39-8]HQR92490.1 hypothetical protein [Sediminibacterium sp.]HQS54469.1 hypothetical protein [Sediminibacterium sp.]